MPRIDWGGEYSQHRVYPERWRESLDMDPDAECVFLTDGHESMLPTTTRRLNFSNLVDQVCAFAVRACCPCAHRARARVCVCASARRVSRCSRMLRSMLRWISSRDLGVCVCPCFHACEMAVHG